MGKDEGNFVLIDARKWLRLYSGAKGEIDNA
jgi:hypothetical protein